MFEPEVTEVGSWRRSLARAEPVSQNQTLQGLVGQAGHV